MERIDDFLRTYGRVSYFRCAYAGGTFDCLHRGHLALFANMQKIALKVVVSLNTDEFAERYKRKPMMPLADRYAVLSACRLVDDVIINDGCEDSKPAILRSGADCIVHGSDWRGESLMKQLGVTDEWLQEHKIDLVTLPYTSFTSTTALLTEYLTKHLVEQIPSMIKTRSL